MLLFTIFFTGLMTSPAQANRAFPADARALLGLESADPDSRTRALRELPKIGAWWNDPATLNQVRRGLDPKLVATHPEVVNAALAALIPHDWTENRKILAAVKNLLRQDSLAPIQSSVIRLLRSAKALNNERLRKFLLDEEVLLALLLDPQGTDKPLLLEQIGDVEGWYDKPEFRSLIAETIAYGQDREAQITAMEMILPFRWSEVPQLKRGVLSTLVDPDPEVRQEGYVALMEAELQGDAEVIRGVRQILNEYPSFRDTALDYLIALQEQELLDGAMLDELGGTLHALAKLRPNDPTGNAASMILEAAEAKRHAECSKLLLQQARRLKRARRN